MTCEVTAKTLTYLVDKGFIDSDNKRGYSSDTIGKGCKEYWIQFGAWKSEDEIKQVVAALRKVFKGG